jgi:hypothetical protein
VKSRHGRRVAVACGTGLVAVALGVYGLELAFGGRLYTNATLRFIAGWWRGAIVVSGYSGSDYFEERDQSADVLCEFVDTYARTQPCVFRTPECRDIGLHGELVVVCPAWLLLVPGLGLLIRPIWLRFRVRPGHCRCGYDLTGNVSGRCPECGRAAESEQVGKWEGEKG